MACTVPEKLLPALWAPSVDVAVEVHFSAPVTVLATELWPRLVSPVQSVLEFERTVWLEQGTA